jgi:hypothetical protein
LRLEVASHMVWHPTRRLNVARTRPCGVRASHNPADAGGREVPT